MVLIVQCFVVKVFHFSYRLHLIYVYMYLVKSVQLSGHLEENSCSPDLRDFSLSKYRFVNLGFARLGLCSGNNFLSVPFSDQLLTFTSFENFTKKYVDAPKVY